jgi:hypothetical protein
LGNCAVYGPDRTIGEKILTASAHLRKALLLKVILAIFDLLPVPPLEGGRIPVSVWRTARLFDDRKPRQADQRAANSRGTTSPVFVSQNSLFDRSGKIGRIGRDTDTSRQYGSTPGPDFANFPVFLPVSREFGVETGSQWTASSAGQSRIFGVRVLQIS